MADPDHYRIAARHLLVPGRGVAAIRNLEAFLPKTRLDKAAKVLTSNVDFLP